MGILNDREITRLSVEGFFHPEDSEGDKFYGTPRKMIEPFAEGKKRPGKISYGVSSYGYDLRIGEEFQIFTGYFPQGGPEKLSMVEHIDPKSFSPDLCHTVQAWEDGDDKIVFLPPYSFALGVSVEKFDIPRDVLCICTGKSTYARSGLYLNCTPLEPEWAGYLTLEILNPTSKPLKVYANEGIGQVVFLRADSPCQTSYRDKAGKYQNQAGAVTFPVVE